MQNHVDVFDPIMNFLEGLGTTYRLHKLTNQVEVSVMCELCKTKY